jgi:hypothetical protein
MKERVSSFEEFQRRVDKSKPVHWAVYDKCVDPKRGVFHRLWLSVWSEWQRTEKEGGKNMTRKKRMLEKDWKVEGMT